jgi:hypothetical protein
VLRQFVRADENDTGLLSSNAKKVRFDDVDAEESQGI